MLRKGLELPSPKIDQSGVRFVDPGQPDVKDSDEDSSIRDSLLSVDPTKIRDNLMSNCRRSRSATWECDSSIRKNLKSKMPTKGLELPSPQIAHVAVRVVDPGKPKVKEPH